MIHLATAAVLNAVWDLWARAEGKVRRLRYTQSIVTDSFSLTDTIPYNSGPVVIVLLQPLWKLLVDMVSHK